MKTSSELAESKMAEAAHAAAISHEATSNAREAQMHETLYNVMREILTAGDEGTKKLLIQKIPLLCTDMMTLKGDVKDIKNTMVTREDFLLVRNIVFGFIALIVVAFMGSLFVLVFK